MSDKTAFHMPDWLTPGMSLYGAARHMAGLSVLDYEHQRREVARHFKVRVGILDHLVKDAAEDRRCIERHSRPWCTRSWPDHEHPDHPNHFTIWGERTARSTRAGHGC